MDVFEWQLTWKCTTSESELAGIVSLGTFLKSSLNLQSAEVWVCSVRKIRTNVRAGQGGSEEAQSILLNAYFSQVGGNRKSCWVFIFHFPLSPTLSGPELSQWRWLWQRGQRAGAEGLRLPPLLHHQYVPVPAGFSPLLLPGARVQAAGAAPVLGHCGAESTEICSVPTRVNQALPLQMNTAVTKEKPEVDIQTGINLHNP